MSVGRKTKNGANDNDSRLGTVGADLLLEHVMATMPGGLMTVDVEGRITSWNRGMEQMTGYEASEVLGSPCAMLRGDSCFHGPRGEGRNRCPLFQKGAIEDKRCRIQAKEGNRVTVLKHARVMRDEDGKALGAIELLTDIGGVLDLEDQVAQLRREVTGRSRFGRLVGCHPSMQQLYDLIELASRSDSSVLLEGETGTGKELVAHAIHASSRRRDGPFIRVACAALSEGLLESELFGHVRGAFTGAVSSRKGRFEAAHGGTLFLDEIGDLSDRVQKKLLRVLQEREFERVGDTRTIGVDIRIVAATNEDLLRLAEERRFRQDLYYRLAVVPVRIPPLRDRRSDIPVLADYFIDRLNRAHGRDIVGLDEDAMAQLLSHEWPGNVRELENALEYSFVVARGRRIGKDHLPPALLGAGPRVLSRSAPVGRPGRATPGRIQRALCEVRGNRTKAAAALGVSRVTLWKWMKALGLQPPCGTTTCGDCSWNPGTESPEGGDVSCRL